MSADVPISGGLRYERIRSGPVDKRGRDGDRTALEAVNRRPVRFAPNF